MTLDSESTYERYDPSGMRDRLARFPEYCLSAWGDAASLAVPSGYRDASSLIVAGMGGSAVMGDLLGDLAAHEGSVPVSTCRGYGLPSYVGRESLVIVSSYSGDTEEALSCFEQAVQEGAMVVAVTRGGKLKARSDELGIPVLEVPVAGEPRTALPYTFVASLSLLSSLGLVQAKADDLEGAVRAMNEILPSWDVSSPTVDNEAKQIATDLQGRIVGVYGSGLVSGVAYRWKTQLNENAKAWAFAEDLPELNHNSVEGYSAEGFIGKVFVVLLRSAFTDERIVRRYKLTQDLLERSGVPCRLIRGRGSSPLADILETTLLGDFTSFYLAMLNRTDPSQTPALERVKASLGSM